MQRLRPLLHKLPGTLSDRVGQKLGPGDTVLDVGCGTGAFAQSLTYAKRFRSRSVVGLDAHLPSLLKARSQGIYRDVVRGDVTRLPFRDCSFEIALCAEVIEHLRKDDGFRLVHELERVATKRTVLTTPNGFVPYRSLLHDPFQEGNPLSIHLSGWEPEELKGFGYRISGNGLALIWGRRGVIFKAPAIFRPFVVATSYALNPIAAGMPRIAAGLICWKDLNHKQVRSESAKVSPVMPEMSRPRVTIVIPTYNRKEDLEECLASVMRISYPSFDVLVVDNASTDSTPDLVGEKFPQVRLIRAAQNLGAAGGRNLGLAHAEGEYVLFLDHDTTIAEDALTDLVRVATSDPNTGLVGPTIYYQSQPHRIWAQGTAVSLATGLNTFFRNGETESKIEHPREVPILPTAFLVRRVVAKSLGGFDDDFFACYEDSDFSFRVRRAGYKVVCSPSAKVWTKEPINSFGSMPKLLSRSYLIARNRTLFVRRYAKLPALSVYLWFFMPGYALWYILAAASTKHVSAIRSYWTGLLDGLRYKTTKS